MKSFIKFALATALISIGLLHPQTNKVLAESSLYMRVLSQSAIIYADQNLTEPMFEVPKTYYVKVESKSNSTIKVSYGDGSKDCPVIIGYMKESDLSPALTEPTTPFAIIKVSTDTSDILFNDVELKTPYFNLPKNEVMYYYGEIESGDRILCYVYYSKKLGYVDKSCLNPFSITPNPDPIETETVLPENNEQEVTTQPSQNAFMLGENLQVIIIIGISVVSISVVYFLFKPQKNRTGEEQNEFSTD